MKVYTLFNPILYGYKEYRLRGDDFYKLLALCNQYCATLSLEFTPSSLRYYDVFRNHRILKPKEIPYSGTYAYRGYPYTEQALTVATAEENNVGIQYFRICPELLEGMMKISDDLFEWCTPFGYNNPQDPTFYRSDGSVFLSTTAHEEECTLIPRENENISDVLASGPWVVRGELTRRGQFVCYDFGEDFRIKCQEIGLV